MQQNSMFFKAFRGCSILLMVSSISLFTIGQEAKDSNESGALPKAVFKKVLNQQFTNIITGKAQTSVGNFASLDLKEGEFSLAGTSIFKNNSVLTVKASGSVTDGLFSIFDNSKLNTEVSLDLQYHFLSPKRKSLTYYDDSKAEYDKKISQIEHEHAIKTLGMNKGQGTTLLQLDKNRKEKLINFLDSLKNAEPKGFKKDSLIYEIEKLKIEITQIGNSLAKIDPAIEYNDIENWRGNEIKKLDSIINVYGFQLDWFSIVYKVSNSSFNLFNPNKSFTEQVIDSNFVSHEFGLQYSYYNWTKAPFETFFMVGGLSLTYSDNLSLLTKQELSETSQYGATNGARAVTKKYNAYVDTGDYRSELLGLRVYGDYYHFLFSNNIASIHLNPEYFMQKGEKPLTNLGIGFLVSFKDSKDQTSILNAELFYNFLDMFKVADSKYDLFERNKVGIRFTVPIKFKN